MLGSAVATLFLVVTSALGFAGVYNQIDAGTKQRVAKKKSLSVFAVSYPLIIYICAVMVLLRWLSADVANGRWIFLNLMTVIMVYSNLLVQTFAGFATVQLVGTLVIFGTGTVNLTAWPLYALACLTVFAERWYGPKLARNRFAYIVPSLIVGAIFWFYMGVTYAAQLSLITAFVNYLAFTWAYLALWDYDQYQRRDQQVVARLTREVEYDGLTQARNWITFQRDFTSQYGRLQAAGPLALVVLDIDHFKDVNDNYGHLVGNRTLMAVAATLMQCLKEQNPDYELYRTGGEEFAIILPGADSATAETVVRECQKQLRTLPIRFTSGTLNVTASFGVAIADARDGNSTAVFKRADHYLYQSKRSGRDRITVEGGAA